MGGHIIWTNYRIEGCTLNALPFEVIALWNFLSLKGYLIFHKPRIMRRHDQSWRGVSDNSRVDAEEETTQTHAPLCSGWSNTQISTTSDFLLLGDNNPMRAPFETHRAMLRTRIWNTRCKVVNTSTQSVRGSLWRHKDKISTRRKHIRTHYLSLVVVDTITTKSAHAHLIRIRLF